MAPKPEGGTWPLAGSLTTRCDRRLKGLREIACWECYALTIGSHKRQRVDVHKQLKSEVVWNAQSGFKSIAVFELRGMGRMAGM